MREYAPDQTVFMFTISAVERRGHRGRAGVFPDGLAVLPGCALSGKWCAARCACQGRYPPKVDPCAEYQFPGRVCLSGRFPPKGTAPEAGMVRGCSVEGARPGVHDRSLHAGFSGGRAWGDCVCIARLFISSGRHVRPGLACRSQRCGSVPSMQMARTTKVLGTLASMGMRWVENWFSEVRLSLARLTR